MDVMVSNRALFLILFLSLTLTAFGQNLPDSGFTNKAEAKNLMVNGLKEGKWIEYMDSNWLPTVDTVYYLLVLYKQNYAFGLVHGYYRSGELYCIFPNSNG